MTAKRFIYNNGFVCDNQTGSCYEMFKNQDGREMADLLNHLHEQKQICRKQQVRQANSIHQLLKEKELLKSQVNEMIELFIDSGLDYHISDELNEILYEDEDWDND